MALVEGSRAGVKNLKKQRKVTTAAVVPATASRFRVESWGSGRRCGCVNLRPGPAVAANGLVGAEKADRRRRACFSARCACFLLQPGSMPTG